MRPPEHKLTVKVIGKQTADPVEEAGIRLGGYRAETSPSGLAEIGMPKGRYELQVWKAAYDIAPTSLDLGSDASVQVEAIAVPEEAPTRSGRCDRLKSA